MDQQGQCGFGINSQNNGSLTGLYDQGQMSKSMPIPILGQYPPLWLSGLQGQSGLEEVKKISTPSAAWNGTGAGAIQAVVKTPCRLSYLAHIVNCMECKWRMLSLCIYRPRNNTH